MTANARSCPAWARLTSRSSDCERRNRSVSRGPTSVQTPDVHRPSRSHLGKESPPRWSLTDKSGGACALHPLEAISKNGSADTAVFPFGRERGALAQVVKD